MSLPRYSEYKPSGVEWLGDVPGHWKVKRLRFVAELNPSKFEIAGLGKETPVSFLPMDAIGNDGKLNLEYEKQIAEVETGYTFFRDGDVTVAKITPCFENGKGAVMRGLTHGIGFGTTELIVARPITSQTCSDYLHALFTSVEFRKNGEGHMYGAGGQKRVPDDFVRNFAIAFPPIEEQRTIAAFLDRETGKIDALIAEQRRLVELLAEKRQAVISHAVTKGLNPNVPMKDSGIEWLGEVPKHWEVPSLGVIIAKAELGENHDSSEGNEGLPVMKMGNLDRGFIKTDKVEYLPEGIDVSEPMLLKDGDFLFNTRNSLDLVGKVAIWRGELSKATFNSNILRIAFNPMKVATSAFMNYFFNSDIGRSQLRSLAKGTTSVAAIYYKDLTTLRLILPPVAEQRVIVTHLDNVYAKLDKLMTETNRAIELLQERRSALISAAVTGKIDVRRFMKESETI